MRKTLDEVDKLDVAAQSITTLLATLQKHLASANKKLSSEGDLNRIMDVLRDARGVREQANAATPLYTSAGVLS